MPLIKIEYLILTGRFLASPFASLGASARNDSALVVDGVRRGLRPRLTPPLKMESVIPNEIQLCGMK